jgi:hypothetical protein
MRNVTARIGLVVGEMCFAAVSAPGFSWAFKLSRNLSAPGGDVCSQPRSCCCFSARSIPRLKGDPSSQVNIPE